MNASTALKTVSIILTLIMLVSNSTINLILAEPIVANPNTVTEYFSRISYTYTY